MPAFKETFIHEFAQRHPFDSQTVEYLERIYDKLNSPEQPSWDSLPYVVLLGASMDRTKHGVWKHPGIVQSDHGFIVGGHSRPIAAGRMIEEGFKGTFLITGGTQQYTDPESGMIEQMSRAQNLANMMVRSYHVPPTQVEVIGTIGKGNTLGNVANTIEYLTKNGIPIGQPIGILSNEWHLPRSLAMFLHTPFFSENCIDLWPINADEILAQMGHHYASWVHCFNDHTAMRSRHVAELNGIHDLYSNEYNPLGS